MCRGIFIPEFALRNTVHYLRLNVTVIKFSSERSIIIDMTQHWTLNDKQNARVNDDDGKKILTVICTVVGTNLAIVSSTNKGMALNQRLVYSSIHHLG